ncbi:MAG: ankyrin repeat domain-containing protein [Planctomycetota bacterium]|jgi:hypothetical protein
MKISLPIKLGIFVVLLFTLVIAACLLWTPVRVRYYTAKLKSDNPEERLAGVEGLIEIGKAGRKALVEYHGCSTEEIEFVAVYWTYNKKSNEISETELCPLHFAAAKGWNTAVELLISKGDDLNVRTADNGTPLHYAVLGDHKDTISLLIQKGADVNARDKRGQTPIFWAILNNHTDSVALLIEGDADVNAQNNFDDTPMDEVNLHDVAERSTIISLLRGHGGKTAEELRAEKSPPSE